MDLAAAVLNTPAALAGVAWAVQAQNGPEGQSANRELSQA